MQPQKYGGYEEERQEEMSPWATIASFTPEHWWHWLVACIPFLTVVNGRVKVNPSQIIQYLIIAGFISVATAYITLSKLEVKFEHIETVIGEVKNDVKQIRDDFYKPHLPGH